MSWIRDIFLIIVSCLIAIKGTDLLFVAIVGEPSKNYLSTAERVITLRELSPLQAIETIPEDQLMKNTDGLEQKPYVINTDENGFIRSANERLQDPAFEVVFFGGSTTETLYTEVQNRFPAVVETLLREEYGIASNVHNAGVSGNNSMHSNLKLLAKGIDQGVDAAVLMHNINDLSLLSKTGSYWQAPKNRAIIREGKWVHPDERSIGQSIKQHVGDIARTLKDILAPNIYTYLEPRVQPLLVSSRETSNKDEFHVFRDATLQVSEDKILRDFERSVRTFVLICQTWDIQPVLMTQFNRITNKDPIFTQAYNELEQALPTDEFVALYGRYNDIIREVAGDYQIALVDLAKAIPQTSEFVYDSVHINDNGSRLVGELIAPILAKEYERKQMSAAN